MYHRAAVRRAQGLQQVAGTDDIGMQRVNRRLKAGFRAALRRQMEYIVRLNLPYHRQEGHQIVQVGILEEYPVFPVGPLEQMLHIVYRTSPAADAMYIPVRILQPIAR